MEGAGLFDIEGLEERVEALEAWMGNTRRVYDPNAGFLRMDNHISTHERERVTIRRLEKETSVLFKRVHEIKASLIALCSAREVHNLIDELKE